MKKQKSYFRTLTKILLFSGSLSMVPISPLFASPAVYTASQQKITGTVKDSKGEALSGATVSLRGSRIKHQADVDGNFELSDVRAGSPLPVAMIGFLNQDVPVTGDSVNVVLPEDAQGLDEVVVVGYGSLDKKELTSAVT